PTNSPRGHEFDGTLEEEIATDGGVDCLTTALVMERLEIRIEADGACVNLSYLDHVLRQFRIGKIGRILCRPEHRYVNFLVAERNVTRGRVTHDHDIDLVGVRFALLVILVPLLNSQAGAGNILGKFIWSEADQLTLKLFAIALTGRINGCVIAHELEARINRLFQRDFERVVIDLLQAGNFLGLALRIFFSP